MQLAPSRVYLTHKLSYSVYSYPPALAAQREHVVLLGPVGPGFVASLHRFNQCFLPEAVPAELPSPPAGSQTSKPWLCVEGSLDLTLIQSRFLIELGRSKIWDFDLIYFSFPFGIRLQRYQSYFR